MWGLIVSVPDHCLSFHFAILRKMLCLCSVNPLSAEYICSVVVKAYTRVRVFT